MAIFKKHVYDIDLKELYKTYCNGIDNVIINSNHTKDYHKDLLKQNIKIACNLINKPFDYNICIVINQTHSDLYWVYMSYYLVFFDTNKISLFLDWHYKKFINKKDFIDNIEYKTYDILKTASLFDNTKRIQKVEQWIRNKRKFIKHNNIHLKWESKNYSKLKKLSEIVFEEKFTKRTMDLHDVFVSNKIITWKETPESLIYLLNKLRHKPNDYITTSKGKLPFFKAVESHFRFYDNSNVLIFRNDLSKVLHNMTKRSSAKYKETTHRLDSIVEGLNL